MHKRQITMQDGRYLIFYTFEDQAVASPLVDAAETRDAGSGAKENPQPEPEATEERSV